MKPKHKLTELSIEIIIYGEYATDHYPILSAARWEKGILSFIIKNKHINILQDLDSVDINLTIRIPQVPYSWKQKSRYCYYHPPHALVQFGICFEPFLKSLD